MSSLTRTILQANLPDVDFVNSGITVADTRAFRTANSIYPSGDVQGFAAGGVIAVAAGKQDIEVASGSIAISAQGTAASGGSGTAFVTAQPTIVMNKIIKAH